MTPTVDSQKPKLRKARKPASVKARKLASLMLDNVENPKPESVGALAIRAGYSPNTARNVGRAVLSTPAFQDLLAVIDDSALLARAQEIALDEDKRAALSAIELLMKLKDRFPAGKLKLQGFNDELSDLAEDPAP